MTHWDIRKYFFELGYDLKPEHYAGFSTYVSEMLRRKRVIAVKDNDQIRAIIFFFITNDYETLYKKGTWEIPEENVYGHQMYLDKMVCKSWKPSLRRYIQSVIEEQFPDIREAYYHRAPKDRCVTIYKRGLLV